MLSILLLILKIIGLIILGIVIVILGLLALILWVPIRYNLEGCYQENVFVGRGKISWLLRIVTLELYQDKTENGWVLRIFGRRMNKEVISKKEAKKEIKDKLEEEFKPREKPVKTMLEGAEDFIEQVESKETPQDHSVPKAKVKSVKEQKKSKNKKIHQEHRERTDRIKTEKEPKAEKQVKDRFWQKLIGRWHQIKAFLAEPKNKKSIHKIKRLLVYLLKQLNPKKLALQLKIGTGDPATTGYLLGALSILYVLKGKDISIEGDFDQAIIQGQLTIRGKLYLYIFAKIGIKLLLDKNIRQWLTLAKNN